MHARAAPLANIQTILAKVPVQAGDFKRRVISSLDDSVIVERRPHVIWYLFALCQIDDPNGLFIKRIGEQQNLKFVGLNVLMHPARAEVHVAVSFQIDAKDGHLFFSNLLSVPVSPGCHAYLRFRCAFGGGEALWVVTPRAPTQRGSAFRTCLRFFDRCRLRWRVLALGLRKQVHHQLMHLGMRQLTQRANN